MTQNRQVATTQPVYERGTLAPQVAAVIRNVRLRSGWSQVVAAYECGISVRHLAYLEAGEWRPSDRIAERLIEGLRLRGKAVRLVRDAVTPGWRTARGIRSSGACGPGEPAPSTPAAYARQGIFRGPAGDLVDSCRYANPNQDELGGH